MKHKDEYNSESQSQMSFEFGDSPELPREQAPTRSEPAKIHSIDNARKRKERSVLIKQINRSGVFG